MIPLPTSLKSVGMLGKLVASPSIPFDHAKLTIVAQIVGHVSFKRVHMCAASAARTTSRNWDCALIRGLR